MPEATDQMLAQYAAELQDREALINGIVESSGGKDLTDEKMELVTRAKDRIKEIRRQMEPLEEHRRLSIESAERIRELAKYTPARPAEEFEYRSAGEYISDKIGALHGDVEKRDRVERYRQMQTRTASHQKTSDNLGLIPLPILGPVIDFIDAVRPLVGALGPRQIPSATFYRPKVTTHTAVAVQSGEKEELTSQAMAITRLTVTPATYGGYVNVSQQNIEWSSPQIMDIIVNDLAQEYAIITEGVAGAAIWGTATATTGGTIDASPTADEVSAAIWSAAGQVYTATKGAGRLIIACSPDVLGSVGPLFAPINPVDAQSSGFTAASFGQGLMGAVSGIPVYVTTGLGATKRLVVMSTAAFEVYENRFGSLQVVEPSVLGVQVAYAGAFAGLAVEAAGIVKIGVA